MTTAQRAWPSEWARRLRGRERATILAYRAGAGVAGRVPLWLSERIAALAGPLLAKLMPAKFEMVARHQQRALRWATQLNDDANDKALVADAACEDAACETVLRRSTADAFGSYARYWLESFRLPALKPAVLDRGIDVPAYQHVEAALERGNGVILALPHLGGWEWAGFWMAAVNRLPITVVVEPIQPPELFAWFAEFRERLGMRVVPLGPAAGREVLGALGRNEIVCLLCDRDLTNDGIEVTFGDECTTLPAGPAMLALRTGAALLPTAVYFRPGGRHLGTVRPPIDTQRRGRLRDDVTAITQNLADELVELIATAPHQWHLFGPNWPSDEQFAATS